MNVLVFDDFYKNPDAVRSLALNASYRDVRSLNYPGYQSELTFVSQPVREKFAQILGRPLDIPINSTTFGKFRVMLKETGSRLKVHVDGACDWTGVLYLNPPESAEGGTAFYRHKETGLEGPPTPTELERFGYTSWFEMERHVIERDTLNTDAWQETMFVGMKYNRLVLFRGGELFHCHTHSFGTNLEDGRMTQNFFFNEATHVPPTPLHL